MTIPRYLETFRRAAQAAQSYEKNEVNEKRGEAEGLNSLNSFISYLPANRFGRFGHAFSALEARCPELVDHHPWQQAVEDGRAFLAKWANQAEALGWTPEDMFGLHTPPANPHPSYRRLSRYDCTGLVWLLQGKEVIALAAHTSKIRNHLTGNVTVFRKNSRPAYGPLGDSLDDFV